MAGHGLRDDLGLAAVPRLALHYPIKKWAAVAGVLSALFYTLLAGAPVPAQRSFLMLAIVLLAVLTDRTALTMRLVCCACPVRDLCEEYVIRAGITGGFWAGQSRELDVDDLDGAA